MKLSIRCNMIDEIPKGSGAFGEGQEDVKMNERIEVMVKKKTSISMKLAQYALVALTVFFFLLCPILLGIFGLILAILTGVVAYFVKMRSVIEYEYTYFDKEMDVDVIYSMQKRKHLKTYDLSKLEVLAPKGSYHLDSFRNRQLKATDFSTHISDNDKNVYEMYIGGSDKVIFEPTPELVKIIANIAPRKVFTD